MATLINQLQSNRRSRNQGLGRISFTPGRMRYAIALPKGERLTATDVAALKTTLQTRMYRLTFATRWQILPLLADVTYNGEAAQTQTSNNGDRRTITPATQAYQFRIWNGGVEAAKNLKTLSGNADAYDLMFVDEKGILMGVEYVDANGALEMGGFALSDIFVDEPQLPTGQDGYAVVMTIMFADASQLSDGLAYYSPSFSIGTEIKSLVNIDLVNVSPAGPPTGVLTVAPMVGGENMADTLSGPLTAVSGQVWKTTRAATGAAVPITGATYVAGLGIRLTHNMASVLPGTLLETTMLDNQALATLGITGYEADILKWVAP